MKSRPSGIASSNAALEPSDITPNILVVSQAAAQSTPITAVMYRTSTQQLKATYTVGTNVSEPYCDSSIQERRRARGKRRAARAAKMQQSEGIVTRFPTDYVDPKKLQKKLVDLFPCKTYVVDVGDRQQLEFS
jgi:hypothetical protein